jgi:hypothetical protein
MTGRVPAEQFAGPEARGPRAKARALQPIAALWRRLLESFNAGYRPERHYMRGPGPKWHERNSDGGI